MADGANIKKQKLFENVTNQPLITGAPEDLILKIFAIPELHLLIGILFFGGYIYFMLVFFQELLTNFCWSLKIGCSFQRKQGVSLWTSSLRR